MKRIFYFILGLISILQCSNQLSKNPIVENYFNFLLVTTANMPCVAHRYENPFQFNDPQDDVKAGFLNEPKAVSYLDLVGGSIQDNPDNVTFELKLAKISETLDVNIAEENGNPEYEWTYRLQADDLFKISIIHFSNGIPEQMLFQNLKIMVWKNQTFLGGCGNLSVQGDSLNWICDKITIPKLKEIAQSKSVFIESKQINQGLVYSDCY